MPEIFGPLCAFLASCTWALGATTYANLSSRFSGPAINFCRSLVSLPLFCLALFLLSGADASVFLGLTQYSPQTWAWFLASTLGSFILGDTLFLFSTRSLGVPAALAIASTYPVWSALAGWLFLGNPFHPLMALAVLLVVGGTILVILEGKRHSREAQLPAKKYWLAVLLAFATSLCWALNAFALSVASQGVPPLLANITRALIALSLCPLLGLALHGKSFRFVPARDLSAVIWVVVLEAFGGSFFFLYGISHSTLATGATLSSLAPVIALALAWMLGRKKIPLASALAIATVVLGIVLLVGLQP